MNLRNYPKLAETKYSFSNWYNKDLNNQFYPPLSFSSGLFLFGGYSSTDEQATDDFWLITPDHAVNEMLID